MMNSLLYHLIASLNIRPFYIKICKNNHSNDNINSQKQSPRIEDSVINNVAAMALVPITKNHKNSQHNPSTANSFLELLD